MLTPSDFAAFFREVYQLDPFPWQVRLLYLLAEQGTWPAVLDLPTGSGKTATIDIAVFHLALEADRASSRRAPVRTAFVVDRRLIVDDAYNRARRLAAALLGPNGPVTTQVAQRLQTLSGDGPPLIVRELRGGLPREADWARTPAQPTVLCSTVDQVGSRLLFRGYGVSDSMKPVHAGLLGADCLILLDEAHLAEPFRQTLEWVKHYRSEQWRASHEAAPWDSALLTATPGLTTQPPFGLLADDYANPILKRRLGASKQARLVKPARATNADNSDDGDEENPETGMRDLQSRTTSIVKEVRTALKHFRDADSGATSPAITVVMNRVARARHALEALRKELAAEIAAGEIDEPILMIGAARPVDRDELAQALEPIRTRIWKEGEVRTLPRPIIIVSTQCIEAGVDIDLDALITELAPLDALRQRFGRLNRAGRDITPYAAIIVSKSDMSSRYVDPVYGAALKPTWEAIQKALVDDTVEFGVDAFTMELSSDVLAPKLDAPVLLPAHLDLLTQTAPLPAADPDLALYLHGPNRRPDAITIVWRADVQPDPAHDEETRRLLTLMPPRAAEAIELPIWVVCRWLEQDPGTVSDDISDVAAAGRENNDESSRRNAGRRVRLGFRWKGDNDQSRWVVPKGLRPGDTLVVPTSYGGVDRFGWNPQPKWSIREDNGASARATDVARKAADPFMRRRFVVRVAPGLLGESLRDDTLPNALANAPSRGWRSLRAALLDLPLPESVHDDLVLLDSGRGVTAYLDAYGRDDEGRPRGVVFVAARGIKKEEASEDRKDEEDGSPNTTEDDSVGSLPGFGLGLAQHNQDVQEHARNFAELCGLSRTRVEDLECSGLLHDLGKADPRFQAWLYYGDPLGPDPDEQHQLAKSSRPLPRAARSQSGLPDHWRHEALSVRQALGHAALARARDPELVLWLVGVHHGYGRPLFPHCDPTEHTPNVGPQSLAFDWHGLDWPSLFVRLKARYGVWELARMEAILRLADHRASAMREPKDGSQ